jgi:hypothetical protein
LLTKTEKLKDRVIHEVEKIQRLSNDDTSAAQKSPK